MTWIGEERGVDIGGESAAYLREWVAVEEVECGGCFLMNLNDSQRDVKAARPLQHVSQAGGGRGRVPLHYDNFESEGGRAAAKQDDLAISLTSRTTSLNNFWAVSTSPCFNA